MKEKEREREEFKKKKKERKKKKREVAADLVQHQCSSEAEETGDWRYHHSQLQESCRH